MNPPPKIEGAPGLVLRQNATGWEARWRCRDDLVKKGFQPKSMKLWTGIELSLIDVAYIVDNCRRLQDEMLLFSRGGMPAGVVTAFDGSLRSLINCYQTDPDSPYQANRFYTRQGRDSMLRRIAARHGDEELQDIKARILKGWHKDWSHDGERRATGSSFIGQLRALFSFGATMLEDPECERLCGAMHKMRFPGTMHRKVNITAEQANAVRVMARERFSWPSIALAQAFQFEGTLRQKDVIGEWVPIAEPGISEVTWGNQKWLRGITWQEIDANLILKHITSKKQKLIVIDLKMAPMVMEELALMAKTTPALLTRDMLPATGAIIKNELNNLPWSQNEYRRKWRKVATAVDIPKEIKNMDSRSGAISEGRKAGATLEMLRHAATHSDISQTADYDRDDGEAVSAVLKLRVEHRNKPKT